MKKAVKYFASIFLYTVLFGLISPVLDMVNVLETYKRPEHWIVCFITAFVVYNMFIYFDEINPRKFYFCFNIVTVTTALVVSSLALVPALITIGIIEGIVVKIVLVAVCVLLYLFVIYAFVCRGVAVYTKGKVRVFKFKIKAYSTDKIEDVKFDYNGKKCVVNIIICGEDNVFKIPSFSARLMEKRLYSSMIA